MARIMCVAVAFMFAFAAVQANQCPGAGECPSDDASSNVVLSLLQAKLEMNVLKSGGEEASSEALSGPENLGKKELWAHVRATRMSPTKTSKDEPMAVRMSQAEEALFRKFLAQSKKYVEFGAGGSTVAAVGYPNLESIHVVESDPAWVNQIKARSDVMAAEETGRLHFHLVDIGKTGAWGYPVSTAKTAQTKFPSYSSAVDSIARQEQLDLVLVDGRFRVACFLHALKHASPSTRIAVHDYTHRQKYHFIEKYADKVEVAEEMNVFKPKANINYDDLDRDIAEYETVTTHHHL